MNIYRLVTYFRLFLLVFLSALAFSKPALELSVYTKEKEKLVQDEEEIYTGRHKDVYQAYSKLVGAQEPFLRYLQWLFIEQGQTAPLLSYPVTLEQIRYIMRTYLNRDSLSAGGKRLYDLIWNKSEQCALWGKEGIVAVDPVLGINGEFYIPCFTKPSREWFLHPYGIRPAFIDVGAEVSLWDSLYINTTAHISQDPTWIDLNPNTFTGNLITNFSSIYALMPQEAYISFYRPHFNLQGGRAYLQWGNGHTGNLLLSPTAGELDYVQVSTWWKFINFTSLWVFLDYSLPKRDKQTGEILYYQAGDRQYAYAIRPKDLVSLGVLPSQFFLAHRLDLKLGRAMDLSLGEAIIYKDKWKNLSFLNPLYFFNNWQLGKYAHYSFYVETQLAVCAGWKLYAQLILEHLDSPWSNNRAIKPSLPVLAGMEVCKELGKAYLQWIFEFIKLDPYAYMGTEEVGLYFDRRWLSSYAGAHYGHNGYNLLRRVPLGYYLGNDLLRFFTLLRYEVPQKYSLWLQYSHLLKGKNSLDLAWVKGDSKNSSYTQMLLSLGGEVRLCPCAKAVNLLLKSDITLGATLVEKKVLWDLQVGIGVNYWY